MRLLMISLLAMLVLGFSAAFAASAYDDVPTDHWAYNSLDYLTQRGVLEGYPDGFFKGDRTLTRYEFAQAVARLLDAVGQQNPDEQIRIMAESLRAEFSDQLAELSRQTQELGAKVGDIETRLGDVEGQMSDNSAKLASIADKIAGMKAGPEWKGAFRYRWQFDESGTDPDFQRRFRQRIAFQLGYNKKINDSVEFGFRLKTETGNTPVSGNHTLGNDGRTSDIFLDRAYVKYTPGWFGYYTDENCKECTPKLDIYAGIFPNITYDPHEMILDSDVNLQGAGVVYHFNKDFQILTAASVAVEVDGDQYFGDDTYLFATELKYNNIIWCGLDAWIGCYAWKNENDLPGAYYATNSLEGFDFNNDGVVDGNDRFAVDFNTIKGGLQYTFQCTFNKPLAVYGEYMMNIDSDAEDRINEVNPFIDPDIIFENTDDNGFLIGAQYGYEPKIRGDWYAFANYKEIGTNAIIGGFGDGDAGGANVNSFEAHAAYMWAENCLVGITYFLNRMNNAFGFLIPDDRSDHSILQVDWTFKF